MSQTYEGSFDVARILVDAAIKAVADAIKFQVFEADELATSDYKHYKLFKKIELSGKQWGALIKRAHEGGILALADVFGIKSAKMLLRLGIDGFKIHPTDIKNIPLLIFLARSGKPLLLSVGGSHKEEIEKAIGVLKKHGAKEIVLLHGFQSYPTLVKDTNLNKIKLLKETFGLPVGFADHIDGDHELKFDLCFLALGMGVSVLEKHITLERILKMEDYESALNPSVFGDFVARVRELETSFGKEMFDFSEAEQAYRMGTKKHIVAARNMKKNTQIKAEDVVMKRTSEEYPFQEIEEIVGKTTARPIQKDRVIKLEDLKKYT